MDSLESDSDEEEYIAEISHIDGIAYTEMTSHTDMIPHAEVTSHVNGMPHIDVISHPYILSPRTKHISLNRQIQYIMDSISNWEATTSHRIHSIHDSKWIP
jgi:hypothetical protein